MITLLMRFAKLVNSARKGRRFVATFEDPKKTIHFGSEKGSTYIDHHDKIKRGNYLKRHKVNENWNKVDAGSPSCVLAIFSYSKVSKALILPLFSSLPYKTI
jgi:hypothetical protein